jgi:hypothetical protein
VGPYRSERRLLSFALAFEQATQFGQRRPDVCGQSPAAWADGHHITVARDTATEPT